MCSKIKHILLTACCLTGAGLMTSCNDGFMDRFPETSITEKVFFSSPADLETYTNGMYGYIDLQNHILCPYIRTNDFSITDICFLALVS